MIAPRVRWAEATIWFIAACVLSGCFRSVEPRQTVQHLYRLTPEAPKADAPVSPKPQTVTPGEYVLADGMELRTAPAWRLKSPLRTTLPGTFGVPFEILMDPCVLAPAYSAPDGVAFIAPAGKAGATYEGKPVFSINDQMGIRVAPTGSPIKLFCDNGLFNGVPHGFAIWSRQIRPEELALFEQTTFTQAFWKPWGRALTYGGVSDGKLTLTYEELKTDTGTPVKVYEKDFTFDLQEPGPTEVSVWGSRIMVLEATSTGITFQVLDGFKGSR